MIGCRAATLRYVWLALAGLLAFAQLACNGNPPTPTGPGASTSLTPDPNPPTQWSAERDALKAGNTAQAITSLEKAVAGAPGSTEAHMLLGQAYYRAGRKADAEKEFAAGFSLDKAAALPLESQDPDELFLIGNVHAGLSQLQEALAAYEAVLKLKPDKAGAYTNIGVVYYQLGRLDDAIAQMQKALQIDPQDAETHYMLGAAYVQKDNLPEAEKSFSQALALKPDLAPAYIGLGNVYLLQKDYQKAADALQKAIRLQPNSPEALLALGQTDAGLGSKAEAVKALNQCVQFSQPGPLRTRCQQVLQQIGAP